jgi:hypothetical protein
MAAADVAAPPFLGSWGSVLLISLAVVYGLSVVVHLANLVLVPVLLVVPGALAWSLYARWLRPHTSPGFDGRFFKMATYVFWCVSLLVMFISLVLFISFVVSVAIDDASKTTETAQALPPMETMLEALVSALFGACIEEVVKVRFLQTPLHLSPAEAGRRAHATLAQTIAIALGFAVSSSVFGLLVSYAKTGGYQSVAAGGAALAIVIDFADRMKGKGLVVVASANERLLKAAALLARRCGCHNINTRAMAGDVIPGKSGTYDGVLIHEAGMGMDKWRTDPERRIRSDERDLKGVVSQIDARLRAGQKAVKTGGRLVYAVGSLTKDETDSVADRLLKEFPHLVPQEFTDPRTGELGTARLHNWPERDFGEALFVTRWTKSGSSPGTSA